MPERMSEDQFRAVLTGESNRRLSRVLAQIPFSAGYGPDSLGADVNIACVSGTHRGALAAQCETGLLTVISRPERSSAIDP